MTDIDFFKKYNDTNGHAAGDKLLANIAGILSHLTRKENLVVRYGGEEFLILLPEQGLPLAVKIAERIRKEVEERTPATISLGVAEFHLEMTQEELFIAADNALYQAKEKGRNRVEPTCPVR